MFEPIRHKTATLPVPNLISRSPWRRGFPVALLALALALFAPSRPAQGADGGLANHNTAEGNGALSNSTFGEYNTAIGFQALFNNTSGFYNTANGAQALYFNTNGTANAATGYEALFNNTGGFDNTATGFNALFSNTTGASNTATGTYALGLNTTGFSNTANGDSALGLNTTGRANTASGGGALFNNATGFFNTATGYIALISNVTGSSNTADGPYALDGNTSGSFNIALGSNAGHNLTTGSNNIDIGNQGIAGESQTIRIGEEGNQKATFIAGIYKSIASAGTPVVVNSSGKLGTILCSARYKEAIKPMDKASEAILALKPVTFRYKHELDPEGIPQFGLVAEQVEKVNPDLVVRDSEGKVYTVRYEAVNAMLLNEFLKARRKAKAEEGKVAQLEATVAKQQKQIEALNAGLQKVDAQLEAKKAEPEVIASNR